MLRKCGVYMKSATLFVKELANTLHSHSYPDESLAAMADQLRAFTPEVLRASVALPPAGAGQEVMYELAEDVQSGLVLYLVSDAPGIVSPPHAHGTWAIIAGVDGVELNKLYRITDRQR